MPSPLKSQVAVRILNAWKKARNQYSSRPPHSCLQVSPVKSQIPDHEQITWKPPVNREVSRSSPSLPVTCLTRSPWRPPASQAPSRYFISDDETPQSNAHAYPLILLHLNSELISNCLICNNSPCVCVQDFSRLSFSCSLTSPSTKQVSSRSTESYLPPRLSPSPAKSLLPDHVWNILRISGDQESSRYTSSCLDPERITWNPPVNREESRLSPSPPVTCPTRSPWRPPASQVPSRYFISDDETPQSYALVYLLILLHLNSELNSKCHICNICPYVRVQQTSTNSSQNSPIIETV